MDWMKKLVEAFSGAADIFTLGRLVFYTAAGALFVYPAVAGLNVLGGPLGGHPFGELVGALPKLGFDGMLFSSTVAGFLIAGLGFVQVVGVLSPSIKKAAETKPVDRLAYPFRFRQLRGEEKYDCNAWLIQEYFRFVEIATYVPLGLLGGLGATAIYSGAYVLAWTAAGHAFAFGAPQATFVAAAGSFSFLAFYVWPRFWVPKVIGPTLEAYHRAKLLLIAALDEASESTQREAAKPQTPTATATATTMQP